MSYHSPMQDKRHPVSPPVVAWKRWTDGWLPELVAVVFGILCFLGLIILLHQCNDKPIFDWHGVTVNALVALLSTSSRASLMVALAGAIGQVKWIQFASTPRRLYDFETVDVASRDAWGRLRLLWRSPMGLASIGAFGAVLALALDPMAQQLVRNQVLVEYEPDTTATVGRAVRYNSGSQLFHTLSDYPKSCNTTGPQTAPLTLTADFEMQSAILNGIGGTQSINSTVQQLTSTCSTGNCTWASFDSLAVCSRCQDVSSQIKQSASDNLQFQSLTASNDGYERMKGSTKFTLPNGVWLETQNNWRWDGTESNLTGTKSMLIASYGTNEPSASLTFGDIDTLIWSATVLRVRPRQPSAEESTKPYVPEAMECGLYYCVKTFSSQVVNGILQESEAISSSSWRDPKSWQLTNMEKNPNISIEPTLTQNQVNDLAGGPCISWPRRSDLRLGELYNISWPAVSTINSFMNDTLASTERKEANSVKGEAPILRRLNGFGITTLQTEYLQNGLSSRNEQLQWEPPVMKPLFETPDLNMTFQRIARSMSNSIRAHGDDGTVATGDLGTIRIHVAVNWPWITLPAVVLVITVVQLVISMVATGRTGAPVWKTSSLATFSRGDYVPESIKASSLVSAMESIGKVAEVDLFANERHESLAKPLYTTSFGRERKRQHTTIRTVA